MAPSDKAFRDALQFAALSDIGMRRSNNQDNHVEAIADDEQFWRMRGHLFVVADGMGAHAAGELASLMAVDNIPPLYYKYRDVSPPEALKRAVEGANTEVHRKGEANAEFHNMGTTCSAIALLPQGAIVAHIGDSRIYRIRNNQIEQLTFDHSLVWEMKAAGQIPEGSDLAKSLPKNVITRSLGPSPSIQVDVEGPFPIEVGDCYLLCSDGLSGQVSDETMGMITSAMPPHEAAQALVDLANLDGGPDNITVTIVRVAGPSLATAPDQPTFQLGGTSKPKPVHPLLWVAGGVSALVGGIMAAIGLWPIAAIAAIVALATLGFACYQQFGQPDGESMQQGARFGKGPYRSYKCEPNSAFSVELSNMCQKLRETAKEMNWQIDWSDYTRFRAEAEEASAQGNHREAVRLHAKVISETMRQTRGQTSTSTSDSTIDLI